MFILRWLYFLFALVIGAASLLTFFKAPSLATWMAAVVAGEFSAWVFALAVVLAVLAYVVFPAGSGRQTTLMVCFFAALLYAKPAIQAHFISEALPRKLELALGETALDRVPFQPALLWDPRTPSPVSVITEAYSQVGTPDELLLDFYPAASPDKQPVPCVVVVHGGGWDNGERTEFPAINRYLAHRGYAVASISYRLAPKHRWPAQRDDVLAAIAHLKTRATALGIDPTRLVLMGRSAGGSIVEAVGFVANDPAICGVVAFYAPADLNFAWEYAREDDVLNSMLLLKQYLGGPPKAFPENYQQASAYHAVGKSTPPTLLVHGKLDTLVWHRQSERLAVRLAKNNVPHYFLSLPWATHAFDYNLHGPGGQLATYALEYFLAVVTKEGGAVFPKKAPAAAPPTTEGRAARKSE